MGGTTLVLEATPEHIAYALMGCFIIVFGLVSLLVKEKLFISEAFVATAFGIIIGPYVIGIFDPASWNEFDKVTLEFTRIVIAIQVMAAGVSLPRSYVFKEKASLFIILVPLMVLMWATSALLIWGLIPDLSFIEAMVIAACVTPTDPVLSNSVVKGRFAEKHVPPRIRYLLSAESGVNDGMGLPFLFLGLYLMRETTTGTAIAKWFYLVWAYQILLSIIIGGVIGFTCRKLLKGAKNRNLIDKESFLVFSIALALAVTGIVSILASDDLLACFVAGNIFAWDDWFSNEIAEAHIQEIIDMLLNLACFVYIGAAIPFSSFGDALLSLSVWRLVVLAIAILFLRRLPYMLIMKPLIPALTNYREAAFAGWFGPMGVGAVFFTKVTAINLLPEHLGENPYNEERLNRVREVIFPVVMFVVLSSVLIHGITVPLLHLQYKYTRTWSKKREDSNHAVTRLPHINIGDEIVLRPPTISGASVSGAGDNDAEQKPVYDHQRSIGYDNQRSVGYDHQRSVNQRSYGYGGFGIAGVPDFSRSNNNTVRTLQDVVKEMKDASRGTANNRSLRPQTSNNVTSNGSNSPPINPRDNVNTSFNVSLEDEGQSASQSNSEQPINKEGADAENIAESLARNHPASHVTGPHASVTPSNSPDDNRSPQSGTPTTKSSHLQPPVPAARQPASVVHIHEDEEEDYKGVVRRLSRDSYEETRTEETKSPQPSKDPSSSGHHRLTDMFKRHSKEAA
ncbi:hypothetical protein BG011_006465 [Mortierella polycephala]|uniref:Cation/H+ exchanger transmembrane domain-containing protein n=1 Tax=Mortierella polycephala TaxID=41804 RepID=A0A9P6QC74_9FUNG|nr:hypothetical protein BG011_006465 [Mortierella polycephala]